MNSPNFHNLQLKKQDSFHSRANHNSLTFLILNTSNNKHKSSNIENEIESDSPPYKTQTQTTHKLYSILNHRSGTSAFTTTNRTAENVISLINQSTNRVNVNFNLSKTRCSASISRKDAVNEKIRKLMQNSNINTIESSGRIIKSQTDSCQVKSTLVGLSKLNNLEKEKADLKIELKQKNEKIIKLEAQAIELNTFIEQQQYKIQTFSQIEKQVDELEKYCNKILLENNKLKQKIAESNELLFQQVIRGIFMKMRILEQNVISLNEIFTKCNKLTILLLNKEEVPLEMFVAQSKRQIKTHTDIQSIENSILNPSQQEQAQNLIELSQKIQDLIQQGNYSLQGMLKKGQKTIETITQKYVSNISEIYNQFQYN